MGGREEYKVRLSLAGKYRIGLNIVRTGKIGVKGLFLEYDEYSAEYSPTNSIRREGSPSKKSLNFIKILGFWLVNTPDPGMSGMTVLSEIILLPASYYTAGMMLKK